MIAKNNPIPAVEAATTLARRVLGRERADNFQFELIEPDNGRDVFELESDDAGRIVLRGNHAVSMATGLNWYLKYHALADVSWCGIQLNFPAPLPRVDRKVRRTAWAKYRYFLNYCCFAYSMPWWDWSQWEKLIDWMALNGVNLPLAVTGQEAVWQAVGRRLGLTDGQMNAFFSGPPFLPFVWMGCLDGWAGPLPTGWIEAHEELNRKIVARERELGMKPVLQGFTGHVPPGLSEKFPDAKLNRIPYLEWETFILDPLDPLFGKVAAIFMEEQERRFGTDHFYANDTFIEMVPPSGEADYLASLSKAIYTGMTASDPEAVWVLQGWPFVYAFTNAFWTQPRIDALLNAVPDEKMLVLDLFCESKPGWDKTNAFSGKPWLWCNVQNFGGNATLTGGMESNNTGLMSARGDLAARKLSGVGMVNEGLCYNPVVYEFLFEQAWREEPVEMAEWMAHYSRHRYGSANPNAETAWRDTLLKTAYNGFHFHEERVGGHKSLLAKKPDLTPPGESFYDNRQLAQAWPGLLAAADQFGDVDAYRFDLANVARHVLSNHSAELRWKLIAACESGDTGAFRETADQFLQLIRDLDDLVATRAEFLLGRWIADARRWGANDAERDYCERNARLVITHFGIGENLHDYARREWAGMLRGYYLPRWSAFFEARTAALQRGEAFEEKPFRDELNQWERNWINRTDPQSTVPQGDTVEVARRLWAEYAHCFIASVGTEPTAE